jgi:peroxiredoxin Q/BCP
MAKNLQVGTKAPEFELEGYCRTEGKFDVADPRYFVLFFYPKDETPGCTIESMEFSKLLPKFKQQKAIVVGISGDGLESKASFCEKFKLNQMMLADQNYKVSKAFGAYGKKQYGDKVFTGVLRQTFVLSSDLKILHIERDVDAKGHAAKILNVLSALSKQAPAKQVSAKPAKAAAKKSTKKSTKSASKKANSATPKKNAKKVSKKAKK